jgi:N6-L-threonylcarbamoyladenine synthase
LFLLAVDELGDAALGFGGGLKVGDGFGRGAGRDEVDDFEVHGARRAHLVFSIQRKMREVRILGIESSCDETAAAVVEDGETALSSVVASQIDTHGKYGGVVPELASREHLRAIVPVVREALEQSGTRLEDLDAVAATIGPGLVGSLLVGLTYAKALCFARGLPLIAVNHIEGHIHAVIMESRRSSEPIEYPALAFVVSGGHTHLFEVREGFRYRLLGRTRDDAAGEAYDKVGKLLGFGYPGGPVIDRLAPYGNPKAVRFTFAKMKGNALDFSFSGLKTAVLRWVQARDMAREIEARRELLRRNPHPSEADWLTVTPAETLGLLASFQHAVITELLTRAAASAETIGAHALIVSGGVACNAGLRAAAKGAGLPYPVHFPTHGLSTDNAAMIAAAAFPKLQRGEFAGLDIAASANLTLAV